MSLYSPEEIQARLLGCRFFIFDLDGTVYQETGHFDFYGETLASYLPEDGRTQYFADVRAALTGVHTVRYGLSYDAGQDIVFDDAGRAISWDGKERNETATPSDNLIHVDDPWGVYGAVAYYHGVRGDELQEAFLRTRQHMESEVFTMRGMPGLREALLKLRSLGLHIVIATNSPQPDSEAILRKLELHDVFEDYVFQAKKPTGLFTRLPVWREEFGVSYADMVSIGDHYRNEILPMHQLGLRTVWIDRYIHETRTGADIKVSHPTEMVHVLEAFLEGK